VQQEEWDAVLSPPRRDLWQRHLRRFVQAVRTGLDVLLVADAALADTPRSARRPFAQPSLRERSPRPVLVVHSHAPEDDAHRRRLEAHLSALKHEGLVETWATRDVSAGHDWRVEIEARLDQADIVVLFLSADYLGSDDCFQVELARAREAHESGRALVLPLWLRAVDAGALWFTELAGLPGNRTPVTAWSNLDEVWAEVAHRIGEAARVIAERRG
jgi:hypothetical protein